MNPALMEMIARARTAEMRGAATGGWGLAGRVPAEAGSASSMTAMRRPAAARTFGLFLVRVGLHLALPRPQGASAR